MTYLTTIKIVRLNQLFTGLSTIHFDNPDGSDLLVRIHHLQTKALNREDERIALEDKLEWRLESIDVYKGEGVLLLRNPWEALRCWWNKYKSFEDKDSGIGEEEWREWVFWQIERWRRVARDWILTSPKLLVVH